jgi:hypothetical protein
MINVLNAGDIGHRPRSIDMANPEAHVQMWERCSRFVKARRPKPLSVPFPGMRRTEFQYHLQALGYPQVTLSSINLSPPKKTTLNGFRLELSEKLKMLKWAREHPEILLYGRALFFLANGSCAIGQRDHIVA